MFFTGSRYIVAGVTLLIAYLGITSQIFVFVPWLRTISISATLAALVPFNLGVAIIYWHYYLACTTNPGSPPPGWGNPEEIREKSSERVAGIGHTDGNLEATSGQSTAVQSTHGAVNPATATTTGPSMELRDRSLRSDISPSPIDPIGHDSTTSPQSTTTAVATAPKKKNMGPLPRYCRSCEAFKPPRSHHCRICKKCVLKMDHHCPWINNCVGHYNYGHFIRFVTWVTITTSYCMILLIARVWDAIKFENYYRYSGDGPTKVQTGFLVINVFVDGGVLIAVGILCIYHLWSMISNTSTIEVWEREKVDAMIKKGKMQKVKYPYDVGCVKNYKQVLGHKPWLWFLWPHPLVDSGTEFEVIQDKHAAKIWPPREYRTTKYKNQTFVSEYTTSAKQGRVHGAREKGRDDEDERTQNRKDGSRSSIYPTHVRRGSEGWVVQDLTIQQRAQLYDLQSNYEHEHPDSQGLDDTRDIEQQEEEYQEGLSDIEGESVMERLPGGMQGGRHQDYEDGQGGDDSASIESVPYDLPSDEYDEDEYDENLYDNEDDNEDGYGDDDYFDEQNPYLAYDDEEEEDDYEEEEEEEGEDAGQQDEGLEDEVSLMGRDRRMIGRFFDHLDPTSPSYKESKQGLNGKSDEEEEDEIDEWDEGEGIQVGCIPPSVGASGKIDLSGSKTKDGAPSKPQLPNPQTVMSPSGTPFNPNGKTFYDLLVERDAALKKKSKAAGSKKGQKKKQ